ncbi:VOC family protein [Streptomyces sp. WAC05374]|uniref:VOC family protein n=1 Tax=Streptomyces sp. WAC05374 TaxID=2487420 RepID=UPI000F897A50|nr:VOC family protein [Streptomyces sp. WAC05374]RST13754.1 VOC family protein [Streptomyces sp. WAC05374]TDF46954.1 VOC family protein [Streptomyces sp. WAC05374]TDF57210.1 VOC family protein [Streptomyces sp. WAC05374]TDF61313.1 VOC family protein [Streptomyces sp. WAC05374]
MGFATLTLTAIDCPEPRRLAEFYAAVLGGEVKGGPGDGPGDGDWINLYLPDGQRLAFQRAPDLRPPEWPRADRNAQQLHLDLTVEDLDAAQERVLALGARPLDVDDDGGKRDFRVYADPAGHPFCLCRA